jgi:hypothetical protein
MSAIYGQKLHVTSADRKNKTPFCAGPGGMTVCSPWPERISARGRSLRETTSQPYCDPTPAALVLARRPDLSDLPALGEPHGGRRRAGLGPPVGQHNTVSARELSIKRFLDCFDCLDEVRKARQRVQGSRGVALDEGTHGV